MAHGVLKRVAVEDLRPGMFVHCLVSCQYDIGHGLSHFTIRDDETIRNIGALGVHYVYIDVDRGIDAVHAPTRREIEQALDESLRAMSAGGGTLRSAPLQEELPSARAIHIEAVELVKGVMGEARLGESLSAAGQAVALVDVLTASVLRNPDALVNLSAIRGKDQYTFYHSLSVCVLLTSFAAYLGLGEAVVRQLALGALFHDIGKMRVRSEVLNKPGGLTAEEFEEMKRHVELGLELLDEVPGVDSIARIVVGQHHERRDGSGYPFGLREGALSHLGQMAAVVDIYDALTAERVYHQAMEPVDALRKLVELTPHHLNQDLVAHFVRTVGIYPVGSLVRLTDGRLGAVAGQGAGGQAARPLVRVFYDTRSRRDLEITDVDLGEERFRELMVANHEQWDRWQRAPGAILCGGGG